MLNAQDFIQFVSSFKVGFHLDPSVSAKHTDAGYEVKVSVNYGYEDEDKKPFGTLTEVYETKEDADKVANQLFNEL